MLSAPVNPSAKNQVPDGVEAQRDTALPARCTVCCSTTRATPWDSTSADTKPDFTPASASTLSVERAGTAKRCCRAAPSTTKRVIVPPTGTSAKLEITSKPLTWSSLPMTPGQNQAEALASRRNSGDVARLAAVSNEGSTARRSSATRPPTALTAIASTTS